MGQSNDDAASDASGDQTLGGDTVDIHDTTVISARPRRSASLRSDTRPLRVEVIGGVMDGLRGVVNGEELTLGRGEENLLVLALDPMVSGRHARLLRHDSMFYLEDVGSRNGTFVEDMKIEGRVPIQPGQHFSLGGTELEFMPR